MSALSGPDAALHAPFRPVRGRRMAIGIGAVQTVVLVSTALLITSEGELGFHWYDRLGVILVSVAISSVLWRFARLSVTVDDAGLVVRNLAGDRRLEWAEVITVRFGGGNPWVTLDLADGEPMAVMAIQRADGAFGEAEAKRLATLVALHSRTDRDD
jgi:hypothetical protein